MRARDPLPLPVLAFAAVAALASATLTACVGDDDASPAAEAAGDPPERGPLAGVPDLVDRLQPSVVAVATDVGEGSGVIYHDDGVIVTNRHVVGEAATVDVRFADGARAEADVVAVDPVVDLAVVRTDRGDLPEAAFATRVPDVGELAIAIGNPFGFENTATAGIVSGTERSIPGGGSSLAGLIQTDAAISPGNSGGALVDAAGEVMGINVAYVPPQGGAVSIGFAIPAPLVVDVVDELLADGEAEHAFLGVTPVSLDRRVAEQYGIDADGGALVLEVQPGSPADTAGIRPGDVVVRLGEDDVSEVGDLLGALLASTPGDRVEVTVLRDGRERTVEVELGRTEAG
jgi:serine protease DegQ